MVVQDSPDTRMTDLIPKGGGKNTSLGLPVDRKHRLKHRFEVVKKLGQGTYGKVQLAVNKETGQEVAIKTIKKSKIESDQDLVRIRREIQIMSSVQHPHIIHIYEVFENKEKIVLVMQYASGGELYDYLSEKKILNDNEARRIFRQIAAAIYYCHKNKICHRDLKLENVLLDERGNAKIADFGLSNVFDDRHLLATYCGSPLYASPEIVKGTPYYGPEVDCWSMGVLLYTLVYGAMPFDGSNFKRLVKQISEGDYYEPKKKSEATGLIRRLLTVNPAKRASIIDICSDWWVNTGYEHSLLQVAEDTANLTPVRLDLLVALAPVSPPPVGGNKFKPSFNTPTVAEAANVSSGVEDSCEEAAGSHEENGEMSSSSFAYVSGGMASEMNVSTENPDDIFHQEHDASDEEFLSADLAAALEGQCIKRPAEKSFDGSMARVSSIAHKSKKPRKSDSLAASKKSLLRVSAPSPDTASSSGQRTDDENEQLVQITKTDTLTAVDQVMAEVDHEKTPEADTVKKTQPTEEATDKPKEEDEQQPKTEETETAKKEPVKKKIVKKTTPESGDGTKKVKRKIISSSAKKAAEKIVEGRADSPPKRSESPSKTRAESPLKVNQRAESPAKSKSPVKGNKSPSPCKVDTKTKTSESPSRTTKSSESPSRTGKTSESPSRATKTSDSPSRATKTSDSPSRTTKTSESPSRTINKSSESPPKVTVAKDGESSDKKEPKKSGSTPGRILLRKRSEASPEKKPLETKPAAIGAARKPGKLVIPRFLESTITTPSPKVVAETPKKLVIPIRSVSDAKKAFEVKTKPTPVNLATPKKTTEKDENSTIKSEIEVQDDKEKTTTTAEETKDTVVAKVNDDKETKTKDTKLEDVPSAMETEKTEKTLEKKEEVTSVKDENKTTTDKPVEESDEEKKVAAKSILKKTLARARLAERKLSQQSSMDSETGSQCVTPPASLVTTPTSQVNATSYFKIPKPYSKENVASNVESKAEITLGKKINKEEKKNNKEETIWGSPMSPSSSSNSKLKRSVLSSSIESDMNNWRTEVEESLKRLSPEGAAEENHSYTSQTSQDSDGGTGPAPITRSYKKFTFTKDGSTITETGEVYTEPKPDGTWTKVEKKTKVTTNQTPVATERKFDKTFKETSPLRHSDSQSSSGSNDVFDDIFDSWTGDSVFGNLLKMDSAFSRFAKDSLRRDRRRESLRRPKSDRTTTRPSRDWTRAEKLAAGHSTDRESSDNEDDFDFHFDGSHPVSYGSQGLMNFMKAMHLNFNDHLRSFKDRHRQGSFSRSLSRDRDDASRPRDLRGRSDSKSGLSGYSAMNRSTSRDRTSSSPRESVLRFVVDHPRRQDSTRSEPRTYHHQRMNSWGSRERLGRDGFDDNVRESGVGSSWDGYASDHGAKFSSPIDSPEVNTDRTSLFGSGRPKGFQRYRESLSKEGGESPSTPQSTKSGPELLDRSRPEGLSDNRRRRVEHWLETNPEDLVDPDNAYAWTTRSLLRDMPEFSSLYEGLPRPKSGFMRYSRSSSDKLADFDERPIFQESGPTSRDRVSNRSPMFRTISEVQVSGNPRNAPQDPSLRDQYDFGSAGTLNDPPVAEKPPKMTRATSQGSATFTRSSSGNPTHVEIVSNPDGSLEMETPVNSSAGSGSRTPVLRMRVSFNGSSESPRVQTTRESPVWQGGAATESTGLWNQERPVSPLWSSDFQDGSSLLEALKNRGYRNVISQRLHHNQYSGSSLLAEDGDREAERVTAERGGTVPSEAGPRAGEAQPNPPSGSRGAKEADAAGGSSTPKRATVTLKLTPGQQTVIRLDETPVITCTIGLSPPADNPQRQLPRK